MEDYDSRIINDYGGGNVQWWQDYMRDEIQRANEYCREQCIELENKYENLIELLDIKKLQDKMEKNNIVIDDLDDKMQKWAFTLYSIIARSYELLKME